MHDLQARRLVPALLLLVLSGAAPAQVSTQPLPEPPPPDLAPRDSARQTGIVTFGQPGQQQFIVRSFEPDPGASAAYRISFEALDTDGDGFLGRAEAAAHPILHGEFAAVDVDGDGRLDRRELAGWLR
ncbi:EF-hand domain-containing protein [Luteimonas sp. SJ-92]|uniref:EF-hand domain-containing protein n=1 Tax=Luteimonas salinisoli TaxID=2752307 RepID=A0A853JEJ7_9GAMM|nr:EF-hand domain-containing protein [Luteimonas salinisoli]NZA27753.1 EF-hand domain-containing protein [Luteimonas salinisoli]